jgi:hypothetical protein
VTKKARVQCTYTTALQRSIEEVFKRFRVVTVIDDRRITNVICSKFTQV